MDSRRIRSYCYTTVVMSEMIKQFCTSMLLPHAALRLDRHARGIRAEAVPVEGSELSRGRPLGMKMTRKPGPICAVRCIIDAGQDGKTEILVNGSAAMIQLPPLPFAKDALIPHISPETLEYHHTRR